MKKGLTRRTFLGNAAFAGAASALRVTPAIAENSAAGDSIEIDTKNLKVVVDPSTCRWSAQVKETPMGINDVYFLPNGDPAGWNVSSAVNKTDDNELGSFVTVALHGTKTGELDFDYQISVSKTDNDILIGLGRTNNTGKSVSIHSMDYFVSSDARLGNTSDKWISLGTHSQNREYYDDLWAVSNLISPKMYEVNHVIRDAVMHVYKYIAPDGKLFSYSQAKVVANFKALAGNTLLLSEALDVPYPEDRIELLKRISPPTMDVAYPVDLFVRKPAQVWNMPIEREFAKWNVLAVFNYTRKPQNMRIWNSIIAMLNVETGGEFTTELDAARDLRLDPGKEYVVYEFWTKTLIGTFKGSFTTRAVAPYECDIYCIVEKQNYPVLISTSRHIRQMAFDIKDLSYDGGRKVLGGVSRAVAGDPYQLRIYVPDGYSAKRVELSGGLTATMATEGNLLKVNYTASTGDDVRWRIFF